MLRVKQSILHWQQRCSDVGKMCEPVVTEKQKALNCVVLNCSIPVIFFKSGSLPFEGSPRCRASRGPSIHTFTLSIIL